MSCNPKIVVFDLDETLGYFSEFGMFWDALKSYIKNNSIDFNANQDFFNKTLDLYPEFLRPNIINILTY
jgi:acid phosphatase class B